MSKSRNRTVSETETSVSVLEPVVADTKATIDGWWIVTGGGHVEIVVAPSEPEAGTMFKKLLRLPTEESLGIVPLDRIPVAGTDAIFIHPEANFLTRGGVQMLPAWSELFPKA